MRRLNAFFSQSLGISLPRVVHLPKEELFCLNEDGLLYGSALARENKYLVQSDIHEFKTSDARGYFLIGYWGHGINSYAFYYSRDRYRLESHIFFPPGIWW